jgi:hypothetical protein
VIEPEPVVRKVIVAVERQELEQLAEKIHDRHQHHLTETWRQCQDAICARIRSWLALLGEDSDDDGGDDDNLLA